MRTEIYYNEKTNKIILCNIFSRTKCFIDYSDSPYDYYALNTYCADVLLEAWTPIGKL